jgi:hypothetical protein
MSEHSDILGDLTLEQLQDGVRLLETQITRAKQEDRTDDAVTYMLTRNAILHEIDVRTEGVVPTYTMTITAHHAVQILSVYYPEKTVEGLMRDHEYDIRTMWNERARRGYTVPESALGIEKPVEMYMHSRDWPSMRPISPMGIIHSAEPALFMNAAPPLNAWWAAEDRVVDRGGETGEWEMVWREWRGEVIHEGWVQRLDCGFMHYLTRYKGGEASPLPVPIKKRKCTDF